MPVDRALVTIAEIAAPIPNAVIGGPFGSNLVSKDYTLVGVPVIRGTNLGSGRWVSGEFVYVSAQKAAQLAANIARPGDIVFTQRGTLGQVSIVPGEPHKQYVTSQSQMKLTVDPAKAEPLYVYYYFRSKRYLEYLSQHTIQTGVPHTNLRILRETPLELPPLRIQRRIAEILGRLDDKIELNRRINRTLEAMARALYRHWFVDFGPFQDGEFVGSELGLVPQGWEAFTVGEVCQVINGATPSTRIADYWNGDICWATPTDMTRLTAPVIFDTNKKITQRGLDSCSATLLPAGSVLVTSRATLGISAINYVPMATNQGFKALICGPRATNHFMLLYMKSHVDEIIGRANGTTFLEINSTNFKMLEMVLPPKQIMMGFDRRVRPFFDQIHANQRQDVSRCHS